MLLRFGLLPLLKSLTPSVLIMMLETMETRLSFEEWHSTFNGMNAKMIGIDHDSKPQDWSDLPSDLLSSIANRLELTELLRFRAVCKDWHSASSTASAEIPTNSAPWFLLYGNKSNCTLITEAEKKHSFQIPELNGTTCIASMHGWVLLLQEEYSETFFFCPFSRAKIYLPRFDCSGLPEHVAMFSSSPTSPDCIVMVASYGSGSRFVWSTIRRVDKDWRQTKLVGFHDIVKTITCASWRDKMFFFFYNTDKLMILNPNDGKFKVYSFLWANFASADTLPHLSSLIEIEKELESEMDVLVAICGTVVEHHDRYLTMYSNVRFPAASESEERRHLKGVWILPRFFQLSPNHSWSLP